MPTKAELETRIAELEATVRRQEKALRELSGDVGMEIRFPFAVHSVELPLMLDDNRHECRDKIAEVIWNVVHEHGIPVNTTPGARGISELSFKGWTPGARFVVPVLAGKMIAALIVEIARYGDAMYRTGHRTGSDLLTQLASGDITPAKFDENIKLAARPRDRVFAAKEY